MNIRRWWATTAALAFASTMAQACSGRGGSTGGLTGGFDGTDVDAAADTSAPADAGGAAVPASADDASSALPASSPRTAGRVDASASRDAGRADAGGFGNATLQSSLIQCLDEMWAEGPPPAGTSVDQCIQDYTGCFLKHGHYINMSMASYHTVSCGFYEVSSASWWGNQDFAYRTGSAMVASPA
jgi:hypothetical protein